MKRKGFTLVELLVVIAVIALLMAILMPVLRRAQDQAMRILCGNREKNLLLAFTMYADTHNNQLPRSGGYWPWDVPMNTRNQLVTTAREPASSSSLSREGMSSRSSSPCTVAMYSATMKKCRPLQPPAISKDPSGMWMTSSVITTGMPNSSASQRLATAVSHCSTGLTSSHTGSAK